MANQLAGSVFFVYINIWSSLITVVQVRVLFCDYTVDVGGCIHFKF